MDITNKTQGLNNNNNNSNDVDITNFRVIHQIWWQGVNHPALHKYENNRVSWIHNHAIPPNEMNDSNNSVEKSSKVVKTGYEPWYYYLWDEESIQKFIETKVPTYKKLYEKLEHPIEKVNLASYLILYFYGGIFVHLDIECVQNLESQLKGVQVALVKKSKKLNPKNTFDGISNQFLASVSKHPFWLTVIREIFFVKYNSSKPPMLASKSTKVHWTTGNYILTRAYYESLETTSSRGIKIYEPSFLNLNFKSKISDILKTTFGVEQQFISKKQLEQNLIYMIDHNEHKWHQDNFILPLFYIALTIVFITTLLYIVGYRGQKPIKEVKRKERDDIMQIM